MSLLSSLSSSSNFLFFFYPFILSQFAPNVYLHNLLVLYIAMFKLLLLPFSHDSSPCCPGQILVKLWVPNMSLLITWLCELITQIFAEQTGLQGIDTTIMECIVLGCIFIVVYCSYIEYNTIHSMPYNISCFVLYCITMQCSLGEVGILFFFLRWWASLHTSVFEGGKMN